MPNKYVFILAILVCVPLLVFFLLGRQLVDAEQAKTRQQFETLLQANLSGIDGTIADCFAGIQQRLLVASIDVDDPDSIRTFVRSQPIVEQVLVLDADGMPTHLRSDDEYLDRIKQLLLDRTFVRRDADETRATEAVTQVAPLGRGSVKVIIHPRSQRQDFGWCSWYWGSGLQLIHWHRLEDGRTLVIGLKRARWMAELIGVLPDSDPDSENRTAPAQIRLIDSDGEVVYLWGAKPNVPTDAQPATQIHLSAPLRPWQLQHFGPAKPFSVGQSATFVNLLAAGGLLFVGLLCMAIYLSREVGRQTREARQRVNFVNQVSHELKTPLTNIRMYADLLEHDLDRIDPEDKLAQSHLTVITSESGRLSRLINNVLTLARSNGSTTRSSFQAGSVDEVIQLVVEQFRPSLDKLDIDVVLDLDATETVSIDKDALEQMLGNLIGNVEKYAAKGKHLRIASRLRNGETTIDVSDAGPGITPAFAKRIFEPFARESNDIVSTTGTGIGLGICRTLARRCGGDLVLRESALGASFRLTLATPVWEGGETPPRLPRSTSRQTY